jgi:hypothetical protein
VLEDTDKKLEREDCVKIEITDLLSTDPYKMEVILKNMMPEGSVVSFYMHFYSFATEWEVVVHTVQEIGHLMVCKVFVIDYINVCHCSNRTSQISRLKLGELILRHHSLLIKCFMVFC